MSRELDAEIAEQVMGYTTRMSQVRKYSSATNRVEPEPRIVWVTPAGLGAGYEPPPFSRDIAAAWLVVEELRRRWAKDEPVDRFWTFKDCGPYKSEGNGGWSVMIDICPDHDGCAPIYEGMAETLPLAICRAALAAVKGAQG